MSLPGVSKTAILTLRARADEHARADRLFADPEAARWFAALEWPAELDGWYGPASSAFLAFRAHELDRLCAALPERDTILELGVGLSTRHLRVPGRFVDLDLPEVIAARRGFGVAHEAIARSVLDPEWLDEIAIDPTRTLILAEGLLYYLPRAEVERLFLALRARCAGAVIGFDLLGPVDYPVTAAHAARAGTPMAWMAEPPFEANLERLGLAPIAEWDLDREMRRSIDLYWPRFGPEAHRMARMLSRMPGLAANRSGVLAGRL